MLVLEKLHRKAGTAAGEVTELRSITEHLHQGDNGIDFLGTLTVTAHGPDLSTAAIQIADNVTDILIRSVDLHLHNRFHKDGIAFHESLLEADGGTGLERHVG